MDADPYAAVTTTKPHAETTVGGHEFTDVDMEAAENLVMLSESSNEGAMMTGIVGGSEEGDFTVQQQQQQRGGRRGCGYNYKNNNQKVNSPSSSSSTVSSVNTRRVGAVVEVVDEELTGPWARLQRYRPIDDVYSITRRMDELEENNNKTATKKRRKKKTTTTNGEMS